VHETATTIITIDDGDKQLLVDYDWAATTLQELGYIEISHGDRFPSISGWTL
jgi:hypothetical protein